MPLNEILPKVWRLNQLARGPSANPLTQLFRGRLAGPSAALSQQGPACSGIAVTRYHAGPIGVIRLKTR